MIGNMAKLGISSELNLDVPEVTNSVFRSKLGKFDRSIIDAHEDHSLFFAVSHIVYAFGDLSNS